MLLRRFCFVWLFFVLLFLDVVSTKGPSVSPAGYVNSEYMCNHCFPFVVQDAVNSRGSHRLLETRAGARGFVPTLG